MAWKVKISATARKQLQKIDHQARSDIKKYLRERIATSEDPRRFGEPLKYNLYRFWRYRIGSYRIIADIQDQEITVLVLKVGHRKKAYGGH